MGTENSENYASPNIFRIVLKNNIFACEIKFVEINQVLFLKNWYNLVGILVAWDFSVVVIDHWSYLGSASQCELFADLIWTVFNISIWKISDLVEF